MTKAALIMMTQCYAVELGEIRRPRQRHRPGLIQTVLSEYFWKNESLRDKQLGAQPIKHLGQPVEIAEIALTLASDPVFLHDRPDPRSRRRILLSSM